MSLSVNLMTRGPAARVAGLLRLLRPAVDEILVAVDDRSEAELVAALAPLADRVVLYPYAEPVDRPLAWLHAECSGKWVLTIDDDEIPSRALLDALPELVRARDVTHYWLPRRWLFPTPGSYLAQPPWRPDYQLRLVENDPRLLSFPDETHKPIAALGPGRYLDLPLYHADCVLNGREGRREKARKYERSRPGRRAGGRLLNYAYYLPELVSSPRLQGVPEEDAPLVDAVLSAPPVEPGGARVEAARATRAEIDRHWQGRALPPSAYRARLTVLEDWRRLTAGEVRAFDLRVENRSGERWPSASRAPELRLSYRWEDSSGNAAVGEGLRTPLPAALEPAESAIVPVSVAAPPGAGHYRLVFDLVHEHVRRFECEAGCEVDVVPRRFVGLMGDDEAGLAAELDRLAESAPELEPVLFTSAGADLPERLGLAAAPGLEPYLLGGLPDGPAGAALVAARTAALAAAARRLRGGTRTDLGRGGGDFLVRLAGMEQLVVGSGNPAARAAAVLAARALGVRASLVGRRAGGERLINRALLRLAARAAATLPHPPARPGPSAADPPAEPPPEWEYVPGGWAQVNADPRVKGWDVEAIAEANREKWPSFVRAVEAGGPLGIYHETVSGDDVPTDDPAAHNMLVTLGYVLALAAGGRKRLSVLDWGGGCGHYYVLSRALLPGVELDYAVKDVPALTTLGLELLPQVTFCEDDEAAFARRYDLVVVSGSLQYAEDWSGLLARLGQAAEDSLYVTRLPVAFRASSFVVLQRAYAYGYDTEYAGWVLNRDELLQRAGAAGLTLAREFLLDARFSAAGAPEDPIAHRGFLWRPGAMAPIARRS